MVASLLAVPSADDARAGAPWFGTWQLDPAKSSSRPDASPYRRVTTRIEPWEDGLKVTYDMVGTRGGVTHVEWTGRFDGKDYAVQGIDYVLTNAYRRIDDRSYEIVVKADGRLAATATAAVSPDGNTLTVTTAERGARGEIVNTVAVYDRRDAGR
jgi:hypothetical protein